MSPNQQQKWGSLPPVACVLGLSLACLLPFLAKPFHVDDTLFLRAAKQIQKHPVDFYGFNINWFGTTQPMTRSMENPPLASYYAAVIASIGGWSEPVLHLGFLLIALAAAAGIFSLATRFCSRPVLAATVAVLAPVFVISGTTLMCDTLLLALWVWAVVFFERGLQKSSAANFMLSGVLAGLAFWTKFTGLALVPLLAAYALGKQCPGLSARFLPLKLQAGQSSSQPPGEPDCSQLRSGETPAMPSFSHRARWLLTPLLILVFVAAYQWITFRLYGTGLFLTSARFSSAVRADENSSVVAQQLVGVSFLGGCFLPTLFYAPILWAGRKAWIGVLVTLTFSILCTFHDPFNAYVWHGQWHPDWVLLLQTILFMAGGIHVLLLAANDCWQRRDAAALLLLLWTGGMFVFATVFNWTCNARSLLPMLPAVGILVARRLEDKNQPALSAFSWRILCPALPALAVSLLVAQADYNLAKAGRNAAKDLCAKYSPQPGRRLWFDHHWGFQYYMEQGGGRPLEMDLGQMARGDLVIIPAEGIDEIDPPCNLFRIVDMLKYTTNPHYSTQSRSAGAGFYAATVGPYPFSAGYVNPECYYVFEAVQSVAEARESGGISGTGALVEQFSLERQAIAWLQTLRTNPNDADAHFQLGRFFASRSDLPAAVKHFSEAVRLRPEDARAVSELAALSLRQSAPRPSGNRQSR
jgi:hypothetical protein